MSSSGADAAGPDARHAVQGHATVGGGGQAGHGSQGECKLYLLTDHEWDSRIVARHEAIMAGAVGPAATGALDAEGVR